MPIDFEDQLRESLRAHAEQVTPNPDTWDRVQRGIRREQRFGWVYAGAAASALAALVAVAVIALPGLLAERQVEFDPNQVAGQPGDAADPADPADPAPDPAPGAEPRPVDALTDLLLLVVGDGGLTLLDGATPRALGDRLLPAADTIAVRPGSTVDLLEVAGTSDCQLHSATVAELTAAGTSTDEGCPEGPQFSPDGAHLAWVETLGDGWDLQVARWMEAGPGDGPGPISTAGFGLDLSGVEAQLGRGVASIRIVDWTDFGEMGGTTGGELLLAITDVDGVDHVAGQRLERQGDGAVALPAGEQPTLFETDEVRNLGLQRAGGGTWSLAVTGGEVVVIREDEDTPPTPLVLDPDIAAALDAPGARVWFDASDPHAVFGDGLRAWAVRWTTQGWTEVAELPVGRAISAGGIVDAQTAQVPGTPGKSDSGTPDLPEAVRATRAALLAAVEVEDLEALAALADPEEFSFSFGADEDPVAFWQAEIDDGTDVLGQLAGLLRLGWTELPSEGGPAITSWPAASGTPYETLSSAELVALEAVVGPDVMATYRDTGQYLGHRVGIRADGSWIHFVAGD